MTILYSENKEKFIAYHRLYSKKKKAPCVVFHHGLMSDMNGKKAIYIENYCKEQGYGFIRFDNFGHGKSSGKFHEQTVTDWLEGLDMVIQQLTNGPVLLIGSSMGGWVSTLYAIQNSKKVIGLIGICAAPDFTEELIWDRLAESEKEELKKNNYCEVTGRGSNCNHTYPISYDMIKDGRKYLLLHRENIEIKCPVHLIHGMQDIDVPYDMSMRLAHKMDNQNIVLKLLKSGDHSLSKEGDLSIICNSIDELSAAIDL